MKIESRVIDSVEAAKVLDDPEIYGRISDDFCPDKTDWPEHFLYVGTYVDGVLAAVCFSHPEERGDELHAQILKDYREHKAAITKSNWDVIIPRLNRPWCEIPDKYPSVLAFAKSYGWEEVAVRKDAYLKDGQRYDSRILELRQW